MAPLVARSSILDFPDLRTTSQYIFVLSFPVSGILLWQHEKGRSGLFWIRSTPGRTQGCRAFPSGISDPQ